MLYANVQKSLSLHSKKISLSKMNFLLFIDNEIVTSLFFYSIFLKFQNQSLLNPYGRLLQIFILGLNCSFQL